MKFLAQVVIGYWLSSLTLLVEHRFGIKVSLPPVVFFTLLLLYAAGFPLLLVCICKLWRTNGVLARVGLVCFAAFAILFFVPLR